VYGTSFRTFVVSEEKKCFFHSIFIAFDRSLMAICLSSSSGVKMSLVCIHESGDFDVARCWYEFLFTCVLSPFVGWLLIALIVTSLCV
jgi:hypothetical protein